MSNSTSTRAPFTVADAVDRAIRTIAVVLLTLAVLALVYRSGGDLVAGWNLVAGMVRSTWATVLDLVTLPFRTIVG